MTTLALTEYYKHGACVHVCPAGFILREYTFRLEEKSEK